MNFGQNILNWLQTNLQPLVIACILGIGVYFFVERKFSKIAGLIVVAIISVGFVFASSTVKDLFLQLFNNFFG